LPPPPAGAQTFNFYLAAFKQFCRWMVKDGRASESPVAYLDGLNVKTDRRHDRRALSADELRRLLAAAQGGPERYGMSGPERAMLYRLACQTGLRAAELASLTRASFALNGPSWRRRWDSNPRNMAVLQTAALNHLATPPRDWDFSPHRGQFQALSRSVRTASLTVAPLNQGGMVTRRCVTMCLERRVARHCNMVTQHRVTMPPPED